jgi:tetratricopeptide (TPR) repeat protein
MRCHDGANTNAPVINPVSHSRHQVFGFNAEGTMTNSDLTGYDPKRIRQTGGECVNCHMPQTVYMQRHSRHDHGFTSPDPLLTKQFGIPNACNRCHQDKDVDWALTNCAQWYGAKMERPARQRAIVVAQAVRGDADSRDAVFALLDREESPYWRAVELRLLEPWADEPKIAAALLSGLENSNALVRTVAAHSLRSAGIASPPVSRALQRRLGDPVRSVRLAAAWSLRATIDPNSPAGRELQTLLDVNADQPLGQMQKGAYFFSRNDFAAALRHFQKAIAWDPGSPPFRWQLAITFSSMNRHREAVETLEEVCRLWPRDAESHYQLGLAYNETGDLKRVTDQLALAVQFDHRHARAWYNLGLAQNSAGESSAAIGSLLRAESVEPDDARIPYARATILARLGRRDEALRAVRRVLEIDRGNPEAMQLLQFLSQ